MEACVVWQVLVTLRCKSKSLPSSHILWPLHKPPVGNPFRLFPPRIGAVLTNWGRFGGDTPSLSIAIHQASVLLIIVKILLL